METRGMTVVIGGDTSGLEKAMSNSSRLLGNFAKESAKAGGSIASGLDVGTAGALRSLSGLTGGLLTTTAAFATLKQGLQLASDFQRINVSLKAVSTSTTDYARSQGFLRSASDQYGLSIEALSKAYVGFKANTNDTILKGAEAERIFLSVAKASAALQLSTEDTTGTLRAFGQMLSKGTVQSEELKGQVGERLYSAFNTAAKAMGVTTMELNKMLQSSNVLATDLLPKLATELDKSFGSAALENVNTMAGGWTRATDQFKLYMVEFTQTNGIDTFFTKMGNGIANTISGMRELQRQGVSSPLDFIGGLGNFKKNNIAEKAGQMRSEFGGLSQGQQKARLELLTEQIKNTSSLLEKTIFVPLLKDLTKAYQDGRRDTRRQNNNTTAVGVDPVEEFKKRKARFDVLTEKRGALASTGQSLTAVEAKELAGLTIQMDRASEATKRHKAAIDSQTLGLTTNELILQRLTQRFKETGQGGTQIALFKGLVEQAKAMTDFKPVNLGDLKSIVRVERLRDVLLGTVAPLQQLPGLAARFNDVFRVNTLAGFNDEADKLVANMTRLAEQKEIIPQSAINGLGRTLEQLNRINREVSRAQNVASGKAISSDIKNQGQDQKWSSMSGMSQNWGDSALEGLAKNRERVIASAKEMTGAVQGVLQQGAVAGSMAMGQFIAGLIQGTTGIEDLGTIILGTIADMLQSLAQALAASAAAMLFVPGLQGQAIAQLAGAAGLMAVSALARSSAKPKGYETGGLFTGESTIRVGESARARMGGGEFVSPVNVGANLIGDRIMDRFNLANSMPNIPTMPTMRLQQSLAGSGSGGGTLTTRVSGSDLLLILDRAAKSKQAFGNG